jgi:hypothetical protein
MDISLYCSPTHFKILMADVGGSSVTVRDFKEFPLPDGGMINGIVTDVAVMASFLDMVAKQHGISTGQVIDNMLTRRPSQLTVFANNIQTRVIEIPKVPHQRAMEFIEQEYGVGEPSKRGGYLCDYTILNSHAASGGVELLTVCVEKEFVEAYRQAFADAGYNLKAINIGINSIVKLAGRLPALRGQTCLLSIIDRVSQTVTLFLDGRYKLMNRYRLLQPPGSQGHADEIAGNIGSVIQFSNAQRGESRLGSVHLIGASPAETQSVAARLAHYGLQIDAVDFGGLVKLSEPVAATGLFDPGNYAINIGSLCKAVPR